MLDHSILNESETRYNLIDPLVDKAGWNLSDRREVAFEVPVDGYDSAPMNGVTDYCMFRENGEVLAVIEAKRTRRDARVGKEQLKQYLDKIQLKQSFRPFGFMCNGEEIWFWDSVAYPERQIAGFFTKADLERLLHLKQNRIPLSEIKIKDSIDIKSNKYDLSISRYKAVEHNVVEYEEPEVVLDKLMGLENEINIILNRLKTKCI